MGVTVREKPKGSGEWYIFIRHNGDRAAHKCVDEEHAIDMQKAVLTAIAAGQFDLGALKKKHSATNAEEKPALPTLKTFFDETMSPLWEASLTESAWSRYEVSFRLHILPILGDTPLNELTRDRVKQFVVSLLQKNAEKRTHGEERQTKEPSRKLSKDSIRLVVAALRAALTEAVEKNLIAVNPATRLGKFYREAGQVREEVDPFTAEEIPLLLDATRMHFGYENYVITLMLFHTGMRAGELAGLQWPDIDTRGKFATVRRQLRDGSHKKTKTKKIRKVDLSDVLIHELETLRKRRKQEYLSRGKNEIPQWVFLGPGQRVWKDGKVIGRTEGQPLDMVNFRNRVFLKACDKANIRRRRLHDTRHTFASILLMNGESPAYVRDQLGHASIKMTVDIYGHWIPGSNRQAVNKLPSLTTAKAQARAAGD